jgi:hypothetical protein
LQRRPEDESGASAGGQIPDLNIDPWCLIYPDVRVADRPASDTGEAPPDEMPVLRVRGDDMDWLLYAVLSIALIVVAVRLGAWLLLKGDGKRD